MKNISTKDNDASDEKRREERKNFEDIKERSSPSGLWLKSYLTRVCVFGCSKKAGDRFKLT